jgi:hypothetical protein
MKSIKQYAGLTIGLMTLVLTGCGSTNTETKGPTLVSSPKEVKVYSTEQYNWQENRSFAFNIARMSTESGAGVGLRDSYDPTNGVQSTGTNTGALAFARGFLAMDALTGISQVFLSGKQADELVYGPFAVSFIDKSSIDLENKQATAEFLRSALESSLRTSAANSAMNGVFKGVYASAIKYSKRNHVVILEGGICKDGANFLAPEEARNAEYKYPNLKKNILGLEENLKNAPLSEVCTVFYESSIAGMLGDKYVVVHEANRTNLALYFHNEMAAHSDMAFVFPENFNHVNEATRDKYFFKFPYSFVTYKGKQFLFDANKDSTPANL